MSSPPALAAAATSPPAVEASSDPAIETVNPRSPGVSVPGLGVVWAPGTVGVDAGMGGGACDVDVESQYPRGTERPFRLLSVADIAAWFGVDTSTVRTWRTSTRFKWINETPFPVPDFEIGGERTTPGWLPEREQEIRAWYAKRPGHGVGGGRPPGSTALGQQ